MTNFEQLIARDKQHVWHPATQMKDLEKYPPLIIERAQGCYLYTNKGRIIDAISSWWCKSLGHGHPTILSAIRDQLTKFEHVITANTTNPLMVELAELLAKITGKQHVFFASDGSSAVEIALKLALQANQIKGFGHKNAFIALKNAYHGETLATLSVSDLGIYKKPFEGFGVPCHFLDNIPYVSGKDDPLWTCCERVWPLIQQQLDLIPDHVCALIVEPLVQGAGGMLCYSADFLRRLALWAKKKNIYFIADEIMTGMGRTGEWLACQHSDVDADMICLSKGLTSGSLPLSCVMIDSTIYDLFYADYDAGKSFVHSHTYSGNPLALSAALVTIKVMQDINILDKARNLENMMLTQLTSIAENTAALTNVRALGGIVAADLKNTSIPRIGRELSEAALNLGALLRPIGNTLYWLPPLNADATVITELAEITEQAIVEVLNKGLINNKSSAVDLA
jgi:adenosylmethionine-8-amino-7-oxononanoate aminotransferase